MFFSKLSAVARCGGFWLRCREPPVVLALPVLELGVHSLLETGVEQIAAVWTAVRVLGFAPSGRSCFWNEWSC